eukprot:gene8136-16723_t
MLTTNNWWKQILPKNLYDRIRSFLLYAPTDYSMLWQVPPQMHVGNEVERIKGYRYPAPGSRVGASVPVRESPDHVFDIKHYGRDYRNLPSGNEIFINSSTKPTLSAPVVPKIGSPGQKNPAVALYDPSGLRTTMTANWPALEKSLAENATPNHLVKPEWENHLAEIWEECDRKGIPRAPGRLFYKIAPEGYTEIKW